VREKETYDPTELEGLRKALGINAVLADTKGDWWIRWRQVESFYESRPTDRHFILEPRDGVVTFGDGKRGMIPPPGRNNVKANVYQQTAGARGNVGAQTITVLEGAIDGVGKVYNVEGAGGGADPETIEEAKLRGPYALKARDRAVTAEDFEYLAKDASIQVAKARCTVRAAAAGREEGYEKVVVVIIPQSTDDKPRPDGQLIRRVQQHLDDHRLITARVRVIGPQYEDVRLYVDVRPHPHYVGRFPDLKLAIEQRLRAFLNPLPAPGRGPDDEGWPMGRTLHKSELYYIVEQVPGVDYVDKLLIWKWEPDKSPAENLKLNESESQDNIYVDTCAFHYFREIQINQV
jgi:predicted phage baseplate assembly protein